MQRIVYIICITLLLLITSCNKKENITDSIESVANDTSDNETVQDIKQNIEYESLDIYQKFIELNTADSLIELLSGLSLSIEHTEIEDSNFKYFPIKDNLGNYGNIYDYNLTTLLDSPSTGFYIYEDVLYFMTNRLYGEFSNPTNQLLLISVTKDGNVTSTVIADDVLLIEPFYLYDMGKLYYTYCGSDKGAYISEVNIVTKQIVEIKEFDLSPGEKNHYTGSLVTMMSSIDDSIVIQLSKYENQNPLSDIPVYNEIIVYDKSFEILSSRDSQVLDNIFELNDYYFEQGRLYSGFTTFINIRNKLTDELVSRHEDIELTDAMGVIELDKSGIILAKQMSGNLFVMDVNGKRINELVNLKYNETNQLVINILDNRLILVQTKNDIYRISK